MEIYQEPLFVPGEIGIQMTAEMPCGVIVLWTYRTVGEP